MKRSNWPGVRICWKENFSTLQRILPEGENYLEGDDPYRWEESSVEIDHSPTFLFSPDNPQTEQIMKVLGSR